MHHWSSSSTTQSCLLKPQKVVHTALSLQTQGSASERLVNWPRSQAHKYPGLDSGLSNSQVKHFCSACQHQSHVTQLVRGLLFGQLFLPAHTDEHADPVVRRPFRSTGDYFPRRRKTPHKQQWYGVVEGPRTGRGMADVGDDKKFSGLRKAATNAWRTRESIAATGSWRPLVATLRNLVCIQWILYKVVGGNVCLRKWLLRLKGNGLEWETLGEFLKEAWLLQGVIRKEGAMTNRFSCWCSSFWRTSLCF